MVALFWLGDSAGLSDAWPKMELDSMGIRPPVRTNTSSPEGEIEAAGVRAMERHIIEAVTPTVDGGRYPAKRIVGEPCVVEADIFRDGHQIIRAALKYRRKSEESF